MPKVRTLFVCSECGHESHKWMGRCSGCGEWNSLSEQVQGSTSRGSGARPGERGLPVAAPQPIRGIEQGAEGRRSTSLKELDRVLGGGVVAGSLVLFGGEPGIGKSTLLLQVAHHFAERWGPVLYVSGEESPQQVSLRAERLGTLAERLLVLPETNVDAVVASIEADNPRLVIVDSIQTMVAAELDSTPGSVAQVRETAERLMRVAKTTGVPVFLVGHLNKQGHLAGPKVLEHAVDAVLYFEGERHTSFRILRAVKNRFGSTDEVAIFEMGDAGLREVDNPSQVLLSQRPVGSSGSVVVASVEGTRPLLLEVQALAAATPFGGTPRRQAAGVDHHRSSIVLAVLEKRCGLQLHTQDVYINVAGGVRVMEPAADLGIAVAVASSCRNSVVDPDVAVFGEVGLAGEVRGVAHAQQRIAEVARLGFKRCIVPETQVKGLRTAAGLELSGVTTVADALAAAGAVRPRSA